MTTGRITHAGRLRDLLAAGPVHAGGCFDALSGRLVEAAGYPAAYISGLAVEATQLARADIGLITRTEMAAHAAHIAGAVDIPVICDVDTGYGDVVNIARTVREFERAGVAGIQIEDQSDPKTCPLLGAPDVLPADVATRRIEAAAQARTDPDFVLIGRTDAYNLSFGAVVERANSYLAAGADVALSPLKVVDGDVLAGLAPDDQMKWHARFCAEIDGPVLGMHVPPGYQINDMFEAGYRMMVLPTLALQAAATAMRSVLNTTLTAGSAQPWFAEHPRDPEVAGEGLLHFLGADEDLALQERLGPRTAAAVRVRNNEGAP